MLRAFLVALSLLLGACASGIRPEPAERIEAGKVPPPDAVLDIPGLGPCTDSADRSLRLNRSEPVKLMVHGCRGSAGEFRALAQVFAFEGQQSACFSYDDRDALDDAAAQLRRALKDLNAAAPEASLTVIGHSQGALIARRALSDHPLAENLQDLPAAELVTISGPFAGIAAARPCGWTWLHTISLGLTAVSCQIATGSKWRDITDNSAFIRKPGALSPQVSRYLKIDTDERQTCRREAGGRCVESDEIFSLAEQRLEGVGDDARLKRLELKAGHVEIVGDRNVAPLKLISALQQEGVLKPTLPARQAAFTRLLGKLYERTAR